MAWPNCSRRALLQVGLLAMVPGQSQHVSKIQEAASHNGLGLYVTHEIPSGLIPSLAELPGEFLQLHFIWSKVGYENWDWSHYDRLLLPLISAGKRLVLMVGWSPRQHELGRSSRNLLDNQGNLDIAQVEMLERLMVSAMRRYPGPHIWCWEEEPDCWSDHRTERGPDGCWGGKYQEFLTVLQAMARARTTANSGALLVLPPVARESWASVGERPTFDMDWLANVAPLGAFDFVDMWGCNYYAPGFYLFHGQGPFSIITKLQKARDSLPSQHRFKPLLVNTGHVAFDNQGGDRQQEAASYLCQATSHLWAAPSLYGLNVVSQTVFCYQHWQDSGGTWGLHAQDGTPRPACREFDRLNSIVRNKPVSARSLSNGYEFTTAEGVVSVLWDCADQDGDGIGTAKDVNIIARRWPGVRVSYIQEVARFFGRTC